MVDKVIDDYAPLATPDGTEQVLVDQGGGVYRTVTIETVRGAQVSSAERTAGTETAIRAFAPADVKSMVDTHAPKSIVRYAQLLCFGPTVDVETGDGKAYLHIPPGLNGMNLVYAHAAVITAGSTGTTDVQIHNLSAAVDMLSTKLTIDSGEGGSDTAGTPAVIDTNNNGVSTNQMLRVDVDAVSTTPPKGLIVTLGFQLP